MNIIISMLSAGIGIAIGMYWQDTLNKVWTKNKINIWSNRIHHRELSYEDWKTYINKEWNKTSGEYKHTLEPS